MGYAKRDQPFTLDDGLFVGEDFTIPWTVLDDDGDVQNVTGWTTQMRVEPAQGQTALVTIAGTVVGGSAGRINVPFTAADLTTIGAGRHWYVFERTDTGNARVLSYGEFVVQAR